MGKPLNRIKEVLEESEIKQVWLTDRLGKNSCAVKACFF